MGGKRKAEDDDGGVETLLFVPQARDDDISLLKDQYTKIYSKPNNNTHLKLIKQEILQIKQLDIPKWLESLSLEQISSLNDDITAAPKTGNMPVYLKPFMKYWSPYVKIEESFNLKLRISKSLMLNPSISNCESVNLKW